MADKLLITFDYPESARHARPVFEQDGFTVEPSESPLALLLTPTSRQDVARIRQLLVCMCYKATVDLADM